MIDDEDETDGVTAAAIHDAEPGDRARARRLAEARNKKSAPIGRNRRRRKSQEDQAAG